ncbi:MAG: hypothetical protein WC483_03900 [Candidatus Paceibacterota bacterium]
MPNTKPILSTQDIVELERLYAELDVIQEAMSDQIKTAQDRYGNDEIEVTRRPDGNTEEKITVKQKVLWQETFMLGPGSPAANDLKKLHPKVFELQEEEGRKVNEIHAYEVKIFGFDRTQMSLPNVIRLVRALIDLEIRNLPANKQRAIRKRPEDVETKA